MGKQAGELEEPINLVATKLLQSSTTYKSSF